MRENLNTTSEKFRYRHRPMCQGADFAPLPLLRNLYSVLLRLDREAIMYNNNEKSR